MYISVKKFLIVPSGFFSHFITDGDGDDAFTGSGGLEFENVSTKELSGICFN